MGKRLRGKIKRFIALLLFRFGARRRLGHDCYVTLWNWQDRWLHGGDGPVSYEPEPEEEGE